MIVAVIKNTKFIFPSLEVSANLMTRFFTIEINAREIAFDLN